MARTAIAVVSVIFIAVIVFRVFLAFQTPLPDYEAYDILRQVDSIRETGLPLYDDPLSYGGRQRVFPPLYPYIMTLFSLFLTPELLIKIVPNIFAAALIFPIYQLTNYMTGKKTIAVITGAMATLIPAAFLIGINDGSSQTLSITLLFTAAYFFLKSRKSGHHMNALIVVLVIMSLVNSLGAVLLIAMFIYIIMLKLERIQIKPKEIEVLIFYFFFTGWISLIIYKKAFIQHGASIIWQNIPTAEIATQFSRITLVEAISSTGLIPLAAGAAGLYVALARTKKKSLVLMASLLLVIMILLWFRLIPLTTGLLVFGVSLVIITGFALSRLFDFLQTTKASWTSYASIALIVVAFLFVSIPMNVNAHQDAPKESDLEVLLWAGENTDHQAVIMGLPIEGSFISDISDRKNVIDHDFILAPKATERYDDVLKLYKTIFKTDAIGIMQKYKATHLLVTPKSEELIGNTLPQYAENDPCFEMIEEVNSTYLFELKCSLRETGK